MMIDSHCHLNMLKLDNYDGELSRLVEANHAAGVSRMLNVCVELDKAQEIISVAENFPYVYASVGEHPSDVQGKLPDYDRLVKLIDHPKAPKAAGSFPVPLVHDRVRPGARCASYSNMLWLGTEVHMLDLG